MPVVSIIMPVFNACESVNIMVESIINQSFADWELIAVDDGSTDGSSEILDRYANIDNRIRVVHKRNGGVASARQYGLEKASGNYIIHADSDDYIDREMLQEMVSVAENRGADIIVADYYVETSSGSHYFRQDVSENDQIKYLYSIYSGRNLGALWHKLIRRDTISKNKISFVSGVDYCEDLLFLTQLLHSQKFRIVHLPKAFYHYVLTPESLTRTVSQKGLSSQKAFHNLVRTEFADFVEKGELNEIFDKNEFMTIYMNNLYENKKELLSLYKNNRKVLLKDIGLRWRIGYMFLRLGLINVSKMFIKY